PSTGQVRQELRDEEECRRWTRELPELRILPDELFEQAQTLLAQNQARFTVRRSDDGRLRGSAPAGSGQEPRHLLAGLIRCAACGASFHVGGSYGRYLYCPNFKNGTCNCQTQLRRDR